MARLLSFAVFLAFVSYALSLRPARRGFIGIPNVNAVGLFERNNDEKVPELPIDYKEAWSTVPDAVNLGIQTTPDKLTKTLGLDTENWVKRDGHRLTLNGGNFRFASLAEPHLYLAYSVFEVEDSMKTLAAGFANPVTRPYVFQIASINVVPKSAQINAWIDAEKRWNFTEAQMIKVDQVIDAAHRYGVRLILPFINQRHEEKNNYAGDTHDLIKLRYGLADKNATLPYSFWQDGIVIDSFKKLITQIMSRNNTVSGIVYKDDPAILAWETGNELQDDDGDRIFNSTLPAPGPWTVEICEHIKSLSPNALCMDGSYSRNAKVERSYAQEALESPAVDILSYHGYGDGDMIRAATDALYINSFGKAYIAGEIGFTTNSSILDLFYDGFRTQTEGAGSLLWSLRSHAYKGGYVVHTEDARKGIYSYHAPGRSPPLDAKSFDRREESMIAAVRKGSYDIAGRAVPAHPIPGPPPALWYNSTSTGGRGLIWKGSAWADHYQLWSSCDDAASKWLLLNDTVLENVAEGTLIYPLSDRLAKQCAVTLVPVSAEAVPGLPAQALRAS